MKARIPLEQYGSSGESCPIPVVMLMVRDRYGTFAKVQFRVDTQADVATVPIHLAEQEAIPFPRERPGVALGLVGKAAKFRGRLRLLIAGRHYDWPCDFVEVPVDPEHQQVLDKLRPVLGRAGLLDEFAVSVDSGYLILTRLGPARRLFRRWLHWL